MSLNPIYYDLVQFQNVIRNLFSSILFRKIIVVTMLLFQMDKILCYWFIVSSICAFHFFCFTSNRHSRGHVGHFKLLMVKTHPFIKHVNNVITGEQRNTSVVTYCIFTTELTCKSNNIEQHIALYCLIMVFCLISKFDKKLNTFLLCPGMWFIPFGITSFLSRLDFDCILLEEVCQKPAF
jgi:hypothetical protein